MQDGGDPGVLALLAQPGVVRGAVAVPRAGQDRRADHDPAGVPGHLGRGDAAGQRGHHPGLAAGRGQQPERGDVAPESPSGPFLAAGSGRLEVNSSDPSGRKRGLPSPSADLVSRRAGPPCASIRQMLVRYFFLSALSVCTAAASQVPSGASRSAVTRGSATKSPRS